MIENKERTWIYKSERRGLYSILIMYLISWGIFIFPYPIISLIGWICLGLIGLSLWKIIDGILERTKEVKNG